MIQRNVTYRKLMKTTTSRKLVRVQRPRIVKSREVVNVTINYGTITWGIITGTLDNQIDLRDRLLQMNGGTF